MVSLSASVLFHARNDPDRPALSYHGLQVTYGELALRVRSCAGMLSSRGVSPGDRVAVLMKNSSAFVEISLAVSHLGAVFLPINFRLAAEEVRYILNHAEAQLLFVDDELAPLVEGWPTMVIVDGNAQSDASRLAADVSSLADCHESTPDTLFRLMYTSGTTDRPKGVMHTYGNYYWKCLDHILCLQLTAADRLLVAGPLYHVGAFDLPGLAVLLVGGMLSIIRDFDPGAALAAIERERLTGGWMAPVMLSRVLALDGRERFDLSSFRWLIGGGERTPEQRIREFGNLFGHARYIDAYGLTETCSGDTLMEEGRELEKIGSTGRATAHARIEIRDLLGKALPAGEQGEVCVRGPKVTSGYWRDPAKTAAAFFEGQWFRTGDIGYVDSDGFLFLTDRLKDMILSGGENIASSEVERVLYQLPGISEAAVIGVPDERWGERVVAVVVPRPGATLKEADVLAHCRGLLAGFKSPKQLVLRDSLPRNPSGKVLKRVLREQLAGEIA